MDRRTFLQTSAGASAGIMLAGLARPIRSWAAPASAGAWRSFEVITRLEILKPSGVTRAWVPMPLLPDTDYHKNLDQGWTGNAATMRVYRDDKYGAGIFYAEWPGTEAAPVVEVTTRFSTRDRVVDLAEELLGGTPADRPATTEPARYIGGDRREHRDLEQLHLVMGFPGPALDHPDYYAAAVLSTAFGGGMSSRLFQEIREKRGLVYAIHSFVHGYRDGGLFGIYAGTGEDEAAELVPALCEEAMKLQDGLTAIELSRAKAQMKAGLLMSLESTSARCEQLAQHLLIYGTPFDPPEVVRRIEAVDDAAIRRVVSRWRSAPPTVAALGPLSRLENYDKLQARLVA